MLDHYLKASRLTETVYRIDQAGGWTDKQNQQARDLVLQQLAGGAEVMRNLIYTAWIKSVPAPAPDQRTNPNDARNTANPLSPAIPLYNPKTGSAPAAKQ